MLSKCDSLSLRTDPLVILKTYYNISNYYVQTQNGAARFPRTVPELTAKKANKIQETVNIRVGLTRRVLRLSSMTVSYIVLVEQQYPATRIFFRASVLE